MSFERFVVNQVVARYPRTQDGTADLTAIINGENILYMQMPDPQSDGASGQYLENGPENRPTILVNTSKPLTHQRFTVAHELGHHFLGHGNRMRDTYEQLIRKDPVEMSANRFAAELLMPETLIRELMKFRYPINALAQRFAVSAIAMTNRLKNLSLA